MFKKIKSKVKSTLHDIQKIPDPPKEEQSFEGNDIQKVYWDKELVMHLRNLINYPRHQLNEIEVDLLDGYI